jgi:hypothetical protein
MMARTLNADAALTVSLRRAPMTEVKKTPRFNRVHAVCQALRDGMNYQGDTVCQRCPIRFKEPGIGWCVKGCVTHAQEVINIAKIGWPWRKPPKSARGKAWRKRVFGKPRITKAPLSNGLRFTP